MSEFDSRPFGKYFLIDEIFRSPFYKNYKAKTYGAKGFEKILLLQVLAKNIVTPKLIERLTEEFQKIVKLSHPNIVTVYDFGCVKEEHFFTQEFLDAISFADYIEFFKRKDQKLPLPQALYLTGEILKGLQAAHQKFEGSEALIHGNINPQNLIISKEGEVKIIGFGWERIAQKTKISATSHPYYFDPYYKRSGKMDQTSDLFQMALVLFELVTGFALMAKLPEDSGEDAITHKFLEQHVDERIVAILEKAFSLNRDERYESALEMSVDIQRVLYANFADFSSMKIVEHLKHFFPNPDEGLSKSLPPFKNEDTLKELVKSSQHQVNFVHREGTEYSTLMADTVALPVGAVDFHPETDSMIFQAVAQKNNGNDDIEKTQDSILPADFSHPDQHSQAHLEKTPAKKSKQKTLPKKKFLVVGLIVLALGILVAVIIFIARNSIDPHWQKSSDEVSLAVYQLWVRSYPQGAEIWVNGQKTNQVTPAQFENFDKSQSYRIVLKKSGFQDYVEVLENPSGKDQVLDIALEPKKD